MCIVDCPSLPLVVYNDYSTDHFHFIHRMCRFLGTPQSVEAAGSERPGRETEEDKSTGFHQSTRDCKVG